MLRPDSVYGFANHEDVADAIEARVHQINNAKHKRRAGAELLAEALAALADINLSIPVHSKQRHLVAGALEGFANGKTD